MNIHTTHAKDRIIIAPCGDIDEHTAREIRRAIDNAIQQGPGSITLDFQQVDFMDSTGIGMMLSRYRAMQNCGIELTVANPNRQVDKVLRLTGIYSIIKQVR
ncbi:MAG: STAS domain-containing protein [Clostridia bacterium]|nr:STAS domain-containing protein [Clostridia bacterium]